ncbi:MAG: flippase [Clostridiales bacterium]|nr:flippase [Clostridiales bacterium]
MNKSLKSNVIFNMIKTLTSIAYPLITFPYASRILGANNLGKVQYCNSIVSYFALMATLGISIYAVREGSKYKEDQNKLSNFSKEIMVINTVSMTIAYLLFAVYIVLIFKESYYVLIIVCSLSIFLNTYSMDWLYQIMEDYKYISLRSLLVQIISLCFLFAFVKTKEDYVAYAIVSLAGTSGSFIFNIIRSRNYIKICSNYKLNLKKHIRPIMIIFGVSLASSIYMNLDTVMIGYFVGTVAVGYYTVAVKVVSMVKGLISSGSNVLFPRLSNYMGTNKIDEYNDLLQRSLKLIMAITIPCAIGLFVLSKEVILLFSGAEYLNANIAAKILAINLIFSVIDGALYYQILLPYGKEKYASFSTIVGAVLNFVLNIFFIRRWSFTGAAFTTLVSELIVFVLLFIHSNRFVNILYMIKTFVKYTLLCVPFIFIYYLNSRIFSSFIFIILFTMVEAASIYFVELYLCKDYFLKVVQDVLKKIRNIFCILR